MSACEPRASILFVLGLAWAATGCDLLDPTVCTTEMRPAIRVAAVDAVSGDSVRGEVRVLAQDGAALFELDTEDIVLDPSVDRRTVAFGPFDLAHERPGVYEVSVEAPGYQLWQLSDLRVRDGECHVRTAELTALLQPVEG